MTSESRLVLFLSLNLELTATNLSHRTYLALQNSTASRTLRKPSQYGKHEHIFEESLGYPGEPTGRRRRRAAFATRTSPSHWEPLRPITHNRWAQICISKQNRSSLTASALVRLLSRGRSGYQLSTRSVQEDLKSGRVGSSHRPVIPPRSADLRPEILVSRTPRRLSGELHHHANEECRQGAGLEDIHQPSGQCGIDTENLGMQDRINNAQVPIYGTSQGSKG
jgi:hypothetical protein